MKTLKCHKCGYVVAEIERGKDQPGAKYTCRDCVDRPRPNSYPPGFHEIFSCVGK